jgi:hypothetical protein
MTKINLMTNNVVFFQVWNVQELNNTKLVEVPVNNHVSGVVKIIVNQGENEKKIVLTSLHLYKF